MTSPDDLAMAVDNYILSARGSACAHDRGAGGTARVLAGAGFLRAYRPLKITPVGRSGRTDVSVNHDLYLTGHEEMTRAVLADTGPLYAAADEDDVYHEQASYELAEASRRAAGSADCLPHFA